MSNMYVERNIQTVIIVNREDCCSDRLANYDIRVGNSPNPWDNPKCNHSPLTNGGIFSCNLRGQYLSITMNQRGVLTLCEVKAFEGPNVALGKSAVQSSTDAGGHSTHPIRSPFISANYYKHSCSHTRNEADPWWYVDLGKTELVAGISLLPRTDCCHERTTNYEVVVGNSPVLS